MIRIITKVNYWVEDRPESMGQKNFTKYQAKLMKRNQHLTTVSWNFNTSKIRKYPKTIQADKKISYYRKRN